MTSRAPETRPKEQWSAHSRPETGCEDNGGGQLLIKIERQWQWQWWTPDGPPQRPQNKMQGTMVNSSH